MPELASVNKYEFSWGYPPHSSLLRAVQWLLDEWEERGRMEGAEAPSDNAVSSVTLTTAASTSNVLIMNFLPEN